MDRYRKKTSTLLTRLTYGLSRKPRPAIVPPSRSPAPQTSLRMTSQLAPWIECKSNPAHSLPTPRRAHPFHSLSRHSRHRIYRSLGAIPPYARPDRRLYWDAGAVSTTVEPDMQGNVVAIGPIVMGTPQVIHKVGQALSRRARCEETQRHCKCFACEPIPNHQHEVLPSPSLLLGRR